MSTDLSNLKILLKKTETNTYLDTVVFQFSNYFHILAKTRSFVGTTRSITLNLSYEKHLPNEVVHSKLWHTPLISLHGVVALLLPPQACREGAPTVSEHLATTLRLIFQDINYTTQQNEITTITKTKRYWTLACGQQSGFLYKR